MVVGSWHVLMLARILRGREGPKKKAPHFSGTLSPHYQKRGGLKTRRGNSLLTEKSANIKEALSKC